MVYYYLLPREKYVDTVGAHWTGGRWVGMWWWSGKRSLPLPGIKLSSHSLQPGTVWTQDITGYETVHVSPLSSCMCLDGTHEHAVTVSYHGLTKHSWQFSHLTSGAVPWIRWLVTSLSPLRLRFNTRLAHAEFLVDKVALSRFSSEYSGFPYQYHSTDVPQ